MTPQPRRKKWTEAEERTLIDKYGSMSSDGILSKMKTREKKYKPIALYVNSVHHLRDPLSYPWQWTWKDVCTKVQNMRHQYSLVKQKIKTSINGPNDEFDWVEGVTHWANFLRYKDVFGDVQLVFNGNGSTGLIGLDDFAASHEMDMVHFGSEDFASGLGNGVMDLEFDYDGDEGEDNYNGGSKIESCLREDTNAGFDCENIEEPSVSKKRKGLKGMEKKSWGFLANQLSHLKEMEARFEQREADRERERQRRENLQMEIEKERYRKQEEMENEKELRNKAREKLRREWIQEWEVMERDSEERERKRREEESTYEREWEERLSMRRLEWKKRMDEMMSQHRAEMGQVQARILHEQQNLTSQFLGIFSQWTGQPSGLSDHTGASGHYLAQMMQGMHHVTGLVHDDEDTPVEGDNQEGQFIVDG